MPHCQWQQSIFEPDIMARVSKELSEEILKDQKTYKFGLIAVSGISGVAIGSVVSFITHIPLAVIRKDSDRERAGLYNVEYTDKNLLTWNYCFLDDLIDTGKTLRRVIDRLEEKDERFTLSKVYLYSSGYREKEGYIDSKLDDIFNVPYFRCETP